MPSCKAESGNQEVAAATDDTCEIDDVYYPEWGTDEFTMEFEWESVAYAIIRTTVE